MTASGYELWRQDDHGNRYLVATFVDRVAAEQCLTELTRVMHKQTYWISEQQPCGGNDGKE